jgi:hypothetical protein
MKKNRSSSKLTGVVRPDLVERVQLGELDPDQAKYMARQEVLSEMPQDFLPLFADLAKVPKIPGRREWFQRQVHHVIHDAWEEHEKLDTLEILTSDEAYADTIEKLKSARHALARIKSSANTDALWLATNEIQRGIDRFLDFSGENTPKPRPRRRGRPKGEVKQRILRRSVLELLDVAWFTGGNLSLEKNIGQGTLIEAIERLERFLPDGAVPRPLPHAACIRWGAGAKRQRPMQRQRGGRQSVAVTA